LHYFTSIVKPCVVKMCILYLNSIFCRYAAIAVASKLSDMQLGESVDIGQLTKKEQKKARYTRKLKLARLLVFISRPEE